MTTRLDTIATRQKKSLVRDALFATFVALAAVISVSSIGTAIHASHASSPIVQR